MLGRERFLLSHLCWIIPRVFGQGNATGARLLGFISPLVLCTPEAVVTPGSALLLPLYFAVFPAAGRIRGCKGRERERRKGRQRIERCFAGP